MSLIRLVGVMRWKLKSDLDHGICMENHNSLFKQQFYDYVGRKNWIVRGFWESLIIK